MDLLKICDKKIDNKKKHVLHYLAKYRGQEEMYMGRLFIRNGGTSKWKA